MAKIYRTYTRETTGHPSDYTPQVFARLLGEGIPVDEMFTTALQLYPRIKPRRLDELLQLIDAQTKIVNQINTIKFPVLCTRMNGGSQNYTTAWVASGMFNLDAVLLGGPFENVPSSRPGVINALQAGNGYGVTCRAIQYMIGDHATTNNGYSMSSGNAPTWYNQLISNNWLLYMNGTSGTTAPNFYRTDFIQTNMSDYASVPLNAYGLKLPDELARQALKNYVSGGLAGCAPNLAGFFLDNQAAYCGGGSNRPATADWDRDGTTDTTKTDAVALKWRTGLKRYFDYTRAYSPGLKLMGNLDAVVTSENGQRYCEQAKSVIAPWNNGMFDGVMHESVFGFNWSVETWAGFTTAIRSIQYYEDLANDPTLNMIGNNNLSANGTDTYRTAPYQGHHYSFYSFLVFSNSGYCFTGARLSTDKISSMLDWYEEFAVNPSNGQCCSSWLDTNTARYRKWMGTAYDQRVAWNASAWSNGVFRRRFNGTAGKKVHVYVNPTASAQTITMDTNLRRLTGVQGTVNTGAAQNIGSTITIPSKDGIILLEQ